LKGARPARYSGAGQRAGSGAEPRHRRIPPAAAGAPPRLTCPGSRDPRARASGAGAARGSLTGPHDGRIRGQPSREGQRDGQRRHYAFARWPGRALTESSRLPAARTTHPGSAGLDAQRQGPPARPSGTGVLASWASNGLRRSGRLARSDARRQPCGFRALAERAGKPGHGLRPD